MKNRSKILLGTMILVIFLSYNSSISFAEAYSPTNPYKDPVEITYANYLNLDDDDWEDDIITNFTIHSPFTSSVYMTGDVYVYMELPSGHTFYTSFELSQWVYELPIMMEWYNCATESGWYELTVILDVMLIDQYGFIYWLQGSDSLIFDPPEEAPGWAAPFAMVYF